MATGYTKVTYKYTQSVKGLGLDSGVTGSAGLSTSPRGEVGYVDRGYNNNTLQISATF